MAYGVIGYSSPGQVSSTAPVGTTQALPSGSVWGDCSSQELTDEGIGFFQNLTFKNEATAPGTVSSTSGSGAFSFDTALGDSVMKMTVTSTGSSFWYRPFAPIAPNGTTKLWYEVNYSQSSSTTVANVFLGFTTSTGLVQTSSKVASATPASNTLTSTAGYIGFWQHGDTPNNFDAIYQKPSGAIVTVLANVLTSNSANNPNPGNPNYVPAIAPGAQDGTHWVKLGVRTDKQYVYWYVNGVQVAKKLIDNTFDIADSYGAIAAAITSSTDTVDYRFSFFRGAARVL